MKQSRLGGGAAVFDGKGDFYSIPAFAPAISNQARSVAFWERSKGASGSTPNKIFLGWGDHGTDAGVRYDVALEDEDDSQLRLEFNSGHAVSTGQKIDLCDGQWHHIVVTYGEGMVRFYVDGNAYGGPVEVKADLQTLWSPLGTIIGAGAREGSGRQSKQTRFFAGQLDDVGIWTSVLSAEDVKLIHGLACVGDNDLQWLEPARKLWQQQPGATARINGCTWRRVNGLKGKVGDWMQVVEPNGAGSFIVLDENGGGLQITPYWWEGRVLQSLGLGLIVLGGAALATWSVARLRWRVQLRRTLAKDRMEAERRRIAQDLHDDLGSGLTEIMSLGDLVEQECNSPTDLKARLAEITGKTRDLVEGLDQIVWTANPVNDEIPKLIGYLCNYAERFLRAKRIRCRLEVPDQLPLFPVNAKARHHILLAIKEALNNTVKHSGATEVWLRVRCDQGELRLVVEDNGKGFDSAIVQSGNGLTNMLDRFTQLGGDVRYESQPGHGTRISFVLPLKSVA